VNYDSVYSLPLVPVDSDGQLHYPEVLRREGLNAVYKRKMSPLAASKTLSLQSSCGYFTD
jgi:hypothetical protein